MESKGEKSSLHTEVSYNALRGRRTGEKKNPKHPVRNYMRFSFFRQKIAAAWDCSNNGTSGTKRKLTWWEKGLEDRVDPCPY